MMKRSILSRNAVLWDQGDPATTIALLEQGRLGIYAEPGLIGVVLPKMTFGEAAILTLDGLKPTRTATVMALADDTVVIEYPAALVKQMVESRDDPLSRTILRTLIGQISRNCLLLMSANKDESVMRVPINGLLMGSVQSAREINAVKSWGQFIEAFRYLSRVRDQVGELCREFVPPESVTSAHLEKVSASVKDMFGGEDVAQYLAESIKSEREREKLAAGEQ